MKKLALAIGLGAVVAVSTSGASLAAIRSDNFAGARAAIRSDNFAGARAATRDARIIVWSGGTNARLVYVNEMLYPDTIDWDAANAYCGDENCFTR